MAGTPVPRQGRPCGTTLTPPHAGDGAGDGSEEDGR